MASFAGTTQKCTACDKTAYLVDRLTADGRVYHKACFRCHHCRNTLKLSNYCSFEGVLYCRPHYDQLYKRTGSLEKSFEGTPKIQKPERQTENENAKVLSNVFLGTKDKCAGCKKTVYPLERVTVNGTPYHKGCFKCTYGGCTISSATFITHEGKLYCKHHHIQLFKEKGNYSQLDGDREKTPSITDEVSALKIADVVSENEEVEGTRESYGDGDSDSDSEGAVKEEVTEQLYEDNVEEQIGDNVLGNALCETERLMVLEASLTCQQNTSSSSDNCVSKTNNNVSSSKILGEQLTRGPSDVNNLPSPVSSSSSKKCEVPKENVVPLSHVGGERDNRDPQNLLDKLNFQLLDKSGREMKIQVTYRTYERKKKKAQKEVQRLATSVNCGGGKGGNGKSVKSL